MRWDGWLGLGLGFDGLGWVDKLVVGGIYIKTSPIYISNLNSKYLNSALSLRFWDFPSLVGVEI